MADPIGDIRTRWEDKTNTVEVRVARSWVRSNEQVLSTALGDEFTLTAKMERVVIVDGRNQSIGPCPRSSSPPPTVLQTRSLAPTPLQSRSTSRR